MGFYSVFGSMAGMTSTLWIAFITVRTETSAKAGYAASLAIVLSSAFFSSLPFMGVGRFEYTGEGVSESDPSYPRPTTHLIICVALARSFAILTSTTPPWQCSCLW